MNQNYFRFRWHHFRRALGRQSKLIRLWLGNYVNRHLYGAWQKLGLMRWSFASWVLLIVISCIGLWSQLTGLDRFWLRTVPVAGGIYREAIVGRVRQVNPLYIDNSATADVAELVFSKLVRTNSQGEVKPDLAESWQVSADKRTYTFKIRKNAKWHDGSIVNVNDILFTFKTIQLPDARSVLASSWDKVVVNALDDQTVQFVLPASYSSFMSALGRVGILPEHSLKNVRPSQLRLDDFNRQPNGSGPFILERLEAKSETVTLRRNPDYFGGPALLDKIQFVQFDDGAGAIDAYAKQNVDGIAQVDINKLAEVEKFNELTITPLRLPNYVGAFFNTARPALADPAVRQALGQSLDRSNIVADILKNQANVTHYPIPVGYPGFNPEAARISYQPTQARQTLTGKFTQRLKLVTSNTGVYPQIARRLAEQWRAVGVPIDIIELDNFNLQQNYIRPRQYDILVYGEDLGGDSDVYSFWHSSQAADPGLNVPAYKNPQGDTLMEQARVGKDDVYRDQKYRDWVSLWAKDVPAVLLYSPYYLYAHTVDLTGVSTVGLTVPSDRLMHAERWAVRSQQAPYKQSQ
ncbi:MAG: ABC transporter substrate-binding protein [bacterium]